MERWQLLFRIGRLTHSHTGRYFFVFILGKNMLGEQFSRARVGSVLDDAVALGPRQARSNQLFPAGTIQVDSLLVAAPSFLYAFRNRLRVAFEFRGSLGGLFPQLVRAWFSVVSAAPQQAQAGAEKAHQHQAERWN